MQIDIFKNWSNRWWLCAFNTGPCLSYSSGDKRNNILENKNY